MFNPHPRLAIALAISTLAIGSSCPALASPQSRSKVKSTIVSQRVDSPQGTLRERAAMSTAPVATPADRVIANAKRKLLNSDPASLTASASKPKSATKVAPLPSDRVKPAVRKPTAKQSGSGTSAFTDTERTIRSADFSAVNELIECCRGDKQANKLRG